MVTNPKIEKIKTEIARIKAKISENQSKLRILERQKTELEDDHIVTLVRGGNVSDSELSSLIQSLRNEKPGGARGVSGIQPIKTTQQEDNRNAYFDEN